MTVLETIDHPFKMSFYQIENMLESGIMVIQHDPNNITLLCRKSNTCDSCDFAHSFVGGYFSCASIRAEFVRICRKEKLHPEWFI